MADFCIKNWRSRNLRPSSMILRGLLVNVGVREGGTHMIGALINMTACHSLEFNGTTLNKPWRKGM